MHECLLCERDMKKSKAVFGSSCIKNIYTLLKLSVPKGIKSKEDYLYKSIMRKEKISAINKEQKIWLSNRYLTYQYLDNIKYGNLSKLKEEINDDIKNINNIDKFESLKTAGKIKLKEAYDLYKKVAKFEERLNELKKGDLRNEDNLKLLLASFSFIFNMNKNKSQYEKDTFKAMQYVFWQTVIEVRRKIF